MPDAEKGDVQEGGEGRSVWGTQIMRKGMIGGEMFDVSLPHQETASTRGAGKRSLTDTSSSEGVMFGG